MKNVESLRGLSAFVWFWYVLAVGTVALVGGTVGARLNDQAEGMSGYWFAGTALAAAVLLLPVPLGFVALLRVGQQTEPKQ